MKNNDTDKYRPCPRCGHNISHYHSKRRRICTKCNRTFNVLEGSTIYDKDKKIKCIRCGSIDTKKDGKTKAGKQMYYCYKCQRKFVPNGKNVYVEEARTTKEVNTIKFYRKLKQPLRTLRAHFKIGQDNLRAILNGTYKSKEERILEEKNN